MALYIAEDVGIVPDGSDIDVDYVLTDNDDDPLTGIVSIEYKLSDNTGKELIPWTNISVSDTGTINIPGEYNRIDSKLANSRELAMYVIYNVSKVVTDKLVYKLNDIIGVTTTLP